MIVSEKVAMAYQWRTKATSRVAPVAVFLNPNFDEDSSQGAQLSAVVWYAICRARREDTYTKNLLSVQYTNQRIIPPPRDDVLTAVLSKNCLR